MWGDLFFLVFFFLAWNKRMLILMIETAVNYCSSFISNSISESWLAKMKNLATAFNLCIFV